MTMIMIFQAVQHQDQDQRQPPPSNGKGGGAELAAVIGSETLIKLHERFTEGPVNHTLYNRLTCAVRPMFCMG